MSQKNQIENKNEPNERSHSFSREKKIVSYFISKYELLNGLCVISFFFNKIEVVSS